MFPLSLATTDGISFVLAYELIYFPHATEMFHFAWFPHFIPHGIKAGTPRVRGFPHSDISGYNAYLRAPRSFSQAIASFIDSYCQGIHRILLSVLIYII